MVFDCGLELDERKLEGVLDHVYRTWPIRDFKYEFKKYNRSDGPWLETIIKFRLGGGNDIYGVSTILSPNELQRTAVSVYDQLLIRINSEMKSFLSRLGVI